MNRLLKKRLKGFMGKTHVFLSLCFLFIFMLIPWEFFEMTVWRLKENWLLAVVGIVVLCGGALFPDLDNDNSSAGATLGPLGSIFTTFMKSTSLIVWNLYHFKADKKPNTMHRYLWHAPIIWVGLGAMLYFGLNGGEYNIFTNVANSFKTDTFLYFLRTNAVLFLFIILIFMAVLVGSNMVIFQLGKFLPLPYIIKYIMPVAVLIYVMTTSYNNLRVIGICFALGAFLHCIEDGFADTGVPSLIFPIPQFWRKRVWGRIKLLPITVTTGGLANKVVDLVSGVTLLLLAFLAFKA